MRLRRASASRPLGWASRPADVFARLPTDGVSESTVLITGPTSGIGATTAAAFASLGAHVVLAARNTTKAEALGARLRGAHAGARVSILELELGSLASVAACAASFVARQAGEGWPPLRVLVCNAGVYNFSGRYAASADGFERTFAVNHLGHFALVIRLDAAVPGWDVVDVVLEIPQ